MCRTAPKSDGSFLGRTTYTIAAATAMLSVGCVQEMANQPRVETYEPSAFFADGSGSRPQVGGTIARGQEWTSTPRTTGMQDGKPVATNPLPITLELLERGRKSFDVYCDHCHGLAGYGDGIAVQRGFPKPPSFHIERLRDAADGHVFKVITNGHGRMPAFKAQIAVNERWAIVGYVRALQLSQHVAVEALSERDQDALKESAL